MKYDDASWHYADDIPPEHEEEFASVHIALYVRWCFGKGWASEDHAGHEVASQKLQHMVKGEIPATAYFMDYCDGKFIDQDLTYEGNEFTQAYYHTGKYLDDFSDLFEEYLLQQPESSFDFSALSDVLNRRYEEYKSGKLN